MNESKVIFEESGGRVRSLKGQIVNEDDFFITLHRNDGTFRIAKKTILKIEELNEEWEHGRKNNH